MSQSINRYDRDHNIDGNVFPFTFVPEYGSSVSFENKNVHFYTADNYYKKFSKGVNGTNVKFNLVGSPKIWVESSATCVTTSVGADNISTFNF